VYTTTFDSFRQIVEGYRRDFGLPVLVTEFAMQVSARPIAVSGPEPMTIAA
jgi:hypothetical protein